ncbi:MAG TPA: phosphate ABC transporter permease PstA [Symbiobacteriaceae bacterium]|nr:phosphate ABC transporter permease PstA [Symbiobacteriaceae bacterium]
MNTPHSRRGVYRRQMDRWFHALFLAAVGLAVCALILLLWQVFSDGLRNLDWQFLTSYASRRWQQAGILAPLAGSFYVMGLTALFALPLGMAAAIHLEFYARDNWLNRLIQTNIANLAGVPSIVYGLFGLAVFVRYLGFDRSILSASLTMAFLILPVVIVNTQEALRTVPQTIIQGAYALGATKWQVIRTVVLPAATGGIMTGAILALSRALGETAPLITVGAWVFLTYLPQSPLDGFTVLPIQIWYWSAMPQQGFQDLAASAIIVLLILLLTMNSVAIVVRNKYQKKAEW